jgi:CheY-like chemotaxis protein
MVSPSAAPPHSKGIVFMTDDEDALREATQTFLEEEGYIVLGARSGSEALARMRGISGPAVAIVDLVMPGMDGWQLIARMRADSQLRRIPIVVLTAVGGEAHDGADRVLRKPCPPAQLLDVVNELCH